jgi:hypothetical protein
MAYFSTFSFFSIFITSSFITNFNLHGVQVIGLEIFDNYAKEKIKGNISIKNNTNKEKWSIYVRYNKKYISKKIFLDKKSMINESIIFPSKKRGEYFIEKTLLDTDFPFGVFYSWKYNKIPIKYFIYPESKDFNERFLIKNLNDSSSSKKLDTDRSDEIISLEKFKENDPVKLIDWKTYSRTGLLKTKKFGELNQQEMIFDYNNLTKLNQEQKLSQLTYWIDQATFKNLFYQVVLPGGLVLKGKDEVDRRINLRKLSSFKLEA